MTATVPARIAITVDVGGINTLTTLGFHEISDAVLAMLGKLFTKGHHGIPFPALESGAVHLTAANMKYVS